ncbi:MAG: hypothetical protein JO148_11925 [Acidimicrobiia bacterium]|nr:hypothetical protein [Acidimicrobiia bacterium]
MRNFYEAAAGYTDTNNGNFPQVPDGKPAATAAVALQDAGNPLEFKEMVDFLKDKGLMMQKIPEQLEIVDTIPRNPSGKIVKHVLRDTYSKK